MIRWGGRKRPIFTVALDTVTYLLVATAVCLLVSGGCCGMASMGRVANERTHRWLRSSMFFFACSLILMALVIAITVAFRLWPAKVLT